MTRPNARRALVTGGHGFLGSHLVDLLLQRGFAVRCLLRAGRPESLFGGRPVEIARGDLRAGEGLDAAVEGRETVFHVAGLVAARSPAEFHAVNALGTARLAAAAARGGCRRFLFVSSQAAAGPSPDGRPIDEDRPPRPLTHYGRSKLAGEQELLRAGLPFTVVRPPAIYGPRDRALLPFFRLAAFGLAPGLEGRGRRFNLLHARDVAEGILLAAEAEGARGRTYFLSDGEGYGYGEVAASMGRAFGVGEERRIPVPDFVLDLAAAVSDEILGLLGRVPVFGRDKATELKARWWLCSSARAERELGWRPSVSLDAGMRETAEWYLHAAMVRRRRGVRAS